MLYGRNGCFMVKIAILCFELGGYQMKKGVKNIETPVPHSLQEGTLVMWPKAVFSKILI